MLNQNRPVNNSSEILESRQRYLSSALKLFYAPQDPLHIVRADKQYMFDSNNRRYLDCINNVCHVGHCHPRVVQAASRQLAVLNTNTRFLHENIVRYAEALVATLPPPLSVCFFVCSGSEANDLAVRLARIHTGRDTIMCLEGSYHGTTTVCQAISTYEKYTLKRDPYVLVAQTPDTYRGPFKNERTAGMEYALDVKAKISNASPAAFICESALSCAGDIILPDGYLQAVYQYARSAGAVCIADEVQTGFGRFGSHYWGFQSQGVVPDIITMGKAMGNGFPVAAVVTTPEIERSLIQTGMEYFNTYGGNPVSCAVGLEVMNIIRDEGLQENAAVVGSYLLEKLNQLKGRYSAVGDVRGIGLFIGLELVNDRRTLEPAVRLTEYVCRRLRDMGIIISIDGSLHNVLKIKPPICFDRGNADALFEALDHILREAQGLDFPEVSVDMNASALDFINEEYVQSLPPHSKIIRITPRAIITPAARDAAERANIEFKRC